MKEERDNESEARANGTTHSESAPMTKVSLLNRIGNAFAVLCGKHGDITAQAEQAGCSRQTVYDHAETVEQAVADAQLPGPGRADLLDQNRRLRDENQQLRQQLAGARQQAADSIPFAPSQRLRLAVVTWAMGLSIYQIEDLFVVLLGNTAKAPDHATIGRWVLAQARSAGKVLAILDEHTSALVRYLCVDEIFFRQKPVLMAVEPFSMTWCLGQRAKDRTGATWLAALGPFDNVEFLQSDQGSGLQKGLRLLIEQRRQEAAKAEAEVAKAFVAPKPRPVPSNGLDLFHIAQQARVPLRARWRKVEKAFHGYAKARAALLAAKEHKPRAVGGLTGRVKAAWQRVEWYWSWYEEQEQAWQRARGAFELFRPDGQLNDRAWAEQEIKAACNVLKGPAWTKVRKLLNDARTLAFLDRTHQELAKAEPRAEVRGALVRLWRLDNRPNTAGCPAAAVVARVVCARLAKDWTAAYARVSDVLEHVLRASSAVECLNSIVRMQQARHRHLSQEMLDLKRLYWNCRPFREGPRADQCPYQLLGASLPTYDFWDLLQMGPDLLRQKLSSQQVAA
jgi:hypothetical protein